METAALETAASLNDQAVQVQAKGNYREAEALYKRSLALWESTLGPDDPRVAQSLFNRASLYRFAGEYAEGERLFQLAQSIWTKRGFPKSFEDEHWADELDSRRMLRKYRTALQSLREQVAAGNSAALEKLSATLQELGPWYHNLDFAPGTMTNPLNRDYPASRWRVLADVIPNTLNGKSVLDIGCNSGFFSLHMKRRGAGRVVGVDIMPHLLAQPRFGSHWFDLPLELHECTAYDVATLGSKFDVVLFIGVLYHLKHPLYALEQIASICNETMYFQSMIRGPLGDVEPKDDYPNTETAAFEDPAWPKLYFVEKKFNGDESNWWFATRSCLKAMLRTAGFKTVEDTVNPEIFVCRK